MGPALAKHRPQHEHAPALRPGRRRRPLARVRHRRALRPHGGGFHQVVGGVSHQEYAGPGLPCGLGEQTMTGFSGSSRETARRLLALPPQRLKPDAEAGGDGAALFGPSGARGLETVVDRQRDHPPPMRVRPRLRQQEQRQRIPAARKRDGQRPLGARREPPVERCQAAHLAWVRAALAFLVTAADAFGYLAFSVSSVVQASPARFMAISSRESSAMASGAQPVLG